MSGWSKRIPDGWTGSIAVLGLVSGRRTPPTAQSVTVWHFDPKHCEWSRPGDIRSAVELHKMADRGYLLIAPFELPVIPLMAFDAAADAWTAVGETAAPAAPLSTRHAEIFARLPGRPAQIARDMTLTDLAVWECLLVLRIAGLAEPAPTDSLVYAGSWRRVPGAKFDASLLGLSS